MIESVHSAETVYRARCSCCGSTGPGSSSNSGSKFLAVITGWDAEDSLCPHCAKLHETKGSDNQKKLPDHDRKGKHSPPEKTRPTPKK